MSQGILRNFSPRPAVLITVEHVVIVLSVIGAAVARLDYREASFSVAWRASFIAIVLQVCLHYSDLYDFRTLVDRRDLVLRLLRALGAASVVLAFVYYWLPALIIGRGVFVMASLFIVGLVAGWRMAFEWLCLRLAPAERLLIVGTNSAAVTLARELFERRSELGVELVGFVDIDPSKIGSAIINPGVIGTISDIPTIVRERNIDRVVVSLTDARGKLSMDELLAIKLKHGVRFEHLTSTYEEYTGKIAVESLRPSWMLFSEGFRNSRTQAAVKRVFDVSLAFVGIMLTAPVMALVALAVRLTSPGPALYYQQRIGKDGRVFTIYKFRSMRVDAEAGTGAVWATAADPRATPVGRFLRRTRLDEIPQLWNVLAGDMSFVGPRPERPVFVAGLTKQIPYYGRRQVVRPGVTGWAQVRHNYASTLEDSVEKLQYDLFYIKHMSLAFDLFIMLETVKTVLVRSGS